MATYVRPQVRLFTEFNQAVTVVENPQAAHLSGGLAQLVRFGESTEKDLGLLGYYENGTDTTYSYPNLTTGATIDQDYVSVTIEDALLKYFQDSAMEVIDDGYGAPSLTRISRAAGSDSLVDNGTAYARDTALLDRDVQVGDVVRVRGLPGGSLTTLWTTVKALIPETVAGSVDAATAATTNAATQAQSTVDAYQTAGSYPLTDLTFASDGTAYVGSVDGFVTETYTVRVTASSIAGDFTTAELQIVSASGTDDVLNVNPSASAVPTAIGSRGLTVTFTAGVTDTDLLAGQSWTVVANEAWTVSSIGFGGTYDLANSSPYIVSVTKGGTLAASGTSTNPEVTVTKADGSDQSGPHEVYTGLTALTIGSDAATIDLSANTDLNKGDVFTVDVTGSADGDYLTIELSNNISEDYLIADTLDIQLFIRVPELVLEQNRAGEAPATNFDVSATGITLNSAAWTYESSWTDGGVPQKLFICGDSAAGFGKAYVTYRAWLTQGANTLSTANSTDDLDLLPGAYHPDNPLKYSLLKAIQNGGGVPVWYTTVTDPSDLNSWSDVLQALGTNDQTYGLVPLTSDRDVQSLFQAFVETNSSATKGRWTTAWFSMIDLPEIPVVSSGSSVVGFIAATTSDSAQALGTFSDDGTGSITVLNVPADNAKFLANGVQVGDTVRASYSNDGFGNETYVSYLVSSVVNETQLRLVSGPALAAATPTRIEVWRTLPAHDRAVQLGSTAALWASRRIRAVWPDTLEDGGYIVEGYVAAAALAALSAGVLPHQGLTNVDVTGFTSVNRSQQDFTADQLDEMAVRGTWILTQDNTGTIYTRHALTTGNYEDLNDREEMVTRNVDNIQYQVVDYLRPYIGVVNVTPSMQSRIYAGLENLLRNLISERFTANLGGQIAAYEITEFAVSDTARDRYIVSISLTLPYALNNIDVTIVVA